MLLLETYMKLYSLKTADIKYIILHPLIKIEIVNVVVFMKDIIIIMNQRAGSSSQSPLTYIKGILVLIYFLMRIKP